MDNLSDLTSTRLVSQNLDPKEFDDNLDYPPFYQSLEQYNCGDKRIPAKVTVHEGRRAAVWPAGEDETRRCDPTLYGMLLQTGSQTSNMVTELSLMEIASWVM
mmetsp:Transcript_21361/g.36144  ORF Transcript_21361/g.36144 Transcript_21361/m.36144 type:complete len:103 (-) Transcript_21361:61-369(-)